jgi:hypothetical protein
MARKNPAIAVALALLAAGCSTPNTAFRNHVGGMIAEGNPAGAVAAIEEGRLTKYGEGNRVLYWLDLAAVRHDARQYDESDILLDRAEQRMEELYTRSLSKATGTVLVNDATEDYAGEPHERALLHVFRALNFAFRNKLDEAVVEARKVTAFLEQYGERTGSRTYRSDAFAHLVAAMLFEEAGRLDDARISRAAAEQAYGEYEAAYHVPAPKLGLAPRSDQEGEVILVHYNGLAPIRGSKKTSVAVGSKPTVREQAAGASSSAPSVMVAIPTIVERPRFVQRSTVFAGGRSADTVLAEPVAEIVTRVLDEQMGMIKARAAARTGAKVGAKAGTEAGVAAAGGNANAVKFFSKAGMSLLSAVEEADTRCWSTLPAQIRLARLPLPEGTHDLTVRFANGSGTEMGETVVTGVEVRKGFRTWIHVRTAY